MKEVKEVKLDILGRVCLPKSMREALGWEVDSSVYVEQFDDRIIISKAAMPQVCPVCNKVFTTDYEFCPFCGQYLKEKTTEEAK